MLRVNSLIILSFLLSALTLSSGLIGCSSDDKKADTAEGAFAIAQEYEKDERYDEAVRRFQEVKNKYPYSRFATMAELAIADVYFKEESFAEAQVSYQAFKDLHPKHPQVDYVTFRLGMSYFHQLPSTIDRDLSLAKNAIATFDDVAVQYPTSQYVAEAKTKKEEALKMLAQKELYIADFYYKRDHWDSALNRYEELLKNYPGLGLDEKALARASISAHRAGDQQKAFDYLKKLETRFPNSDELRSAKKENND